MVELKHKITSLEVFLLSILFVFLAGLSTEIINWYTGDSLWQYTTGWGEFSHVLFGTVTVGVLLGWLLVGIIVGLLVLYVAKKVEWGHQ